MAGSNCILQKVRLEYLMACLAFRPKCHLKLRQLSILRSAVLHNCLCFAFVCLQFLGKENFLEGFHLFLMTCGDDFSWKKRSAEV